MAYSLIHNRDTSLKYSIYLNDELVVKNVAAHHVESVVDSLTAEGFNITNESWDDEAMRVNLTSISGFDTDDDYID